MFRENRRARVLCGLVLTVVFGGFLPSSRAQFTDQSCLEAEPGFVASGGTNGVMSVQADDLDKNQLMDVVTASFGDDRVTWFQNVGTDSAPVFVPQTITASADGAAAVFLARLDEVLPPFPNPNPVTPFGCLDVLVASSNDDTIAWYEQGCDKGVPSSEFTGHVITQNADGALAVHAADINGDRCLDVLAASFNDNTVAVYEQGCDTTVMGPPLPLKTFTERIVTTTAPGAGAVWVTDIDGDLRVDDIVVGSRLDNTIAWFRYVAGDPQVEGDPPTFERFVIATNAQRVASVVTADLDADDDIDVVSASPNDDKVTWYENQGGDPPTWFPRLISTSAEGARSVAIAQIDSGAASDIVVASSDDGTIRWFKNVPSVIPEVPPTFEEHPISSNAPGANAAVPADFNGDGYPDVVSVSSASGSTASNDRVAWHESDGGSLPGFTEHVISTHAILPESLVLADIDGVNGLDVVVASSVDDTVAWYENNGLDPPNLAFSPRVVTTLAEGVLSIAAGEINSGDDDIDLVSASPGDNKIAWYENLGGGAAFTEHLISSNAEGASAVFVFDVDRGFPGDLDVLSASRIDNKVSWYENVGASTGVFVEHPISTQVDGASAVHAKDVDLDGDTDVLAAARDSGEILLFVNENDTEDFSEVVVVSANAAGARAVVAAELADLNSADEPANPFNPMEIVAASASNNRVSWFALVRDESTVPCLLSTPGSGATFSPNPPVFDLLYVGLDETETVTITNTGQAPLTTFTIEGAGAAAFTITQPGTILPDGNGVVTIAFTPTAAELSCAELVASNGTEQARLLLSGRGQTWVESVVTATAFFARSVFLEDVTGDGRRDILVASSGDDTISVFVQEGEAPAITFSERVVTNRAESARAVVAGDLDGKLDIRNNLRNEVVTASLFEVDWHEGGVVEECNFFDVDAPAAGAYGKINGVELGWIGAAFGKDDDPGTLDEWFEKVDYNGDLTIDGEDLAILSAGGVFGESTHTPGTTPEEDEETPDDLCHFTCISQD